MYRPGSSTHHSGYIPLNRAQLCGSLNDRRLWENVDQDMCLVGYPILKASNVRFKPNAFCFLTPIPFTAVPNVFDYISLHSFSKSIKCRIFILLHLIMESKEDHSLFSSLTVIAQQYAHRSLSTKSHFLNHFPRLDNNIFSIIYLESQTCLTTMYAPLLNKLSRM